MRGSVGRRTASGLFLIWFAVFGLTRGILGVCPQHGSGHASASEARSASVAPSTMHHHVGTDVGASSADTHESTMHDAATHTGDGDPAPHGCDCRGECCCCAAPQVGFGSIHVFALEARIAMPRREATSADRPLLRVDFALPFPTAPPRGNAA